MVVVVWEIYDIGSSIVVVELGCGDGFLVDILANVDGPTLDGNIVLVTFETANVVKVALGSVDKLGVDEVDGAATGVVTATKKVWNEINAKFNHWVKNINWQITNSFKLII